MRTEPPTGVAVVGAGPYGLAAASHLRANGVPTHVFGRALEYWREHMPAGMRLRSSWTASSIASPRGELSLRAYEQALGRQLERPVPLADFIRYGLWYQASAVPDLDTRRVTRIAPARRGFAVSLADGEELEFGRVVLATGLHEFPRRPAPFQELPPELVTHTADHAELNRFAGCRVLVVGGGQSAIETAVLASEAGASVQVLMRAGGVHWLTRSARLHQRPGPMGRALYAPTDVGPAGMSWLVAAPGLLRHFSTPARLAMIRRCLRPAASDWLLARSQALELTCGRCAVAAEPGSAGGVRVTLDDGRRLDADHVLLGTGFAPDLASVSLLAPELRESMRQQDGYPLLRAGFESSVPGLHAVGALAAYSFGPVMRFVSGSWYTAPALARAVAYRRTWQPSRGHACTASPAPADVAQPHA